MARPQRKRVSSAILFGHPTIRVGEIELDKESYRSLLANNQAFAIRRHKNSGDRKMAAKALACGRFVAAQSLNGLYEPTFYCKAVRFCRRCYCCREHARGDSIAGDTFTAKRELNLLQYVFTMPRPRCATEEDNFTLQAYEGMGRLALAKKRWNIQRSNLSSQQIESYAMGLHLKYDEATKLFWPHVHLAIVAGKDVHCGYAPECGLLRSLKPAFENANDFPDTIVIKSQKVGRLGNNAISDRLRIEKHRAKVVTQIHLANALSYCTRNIEDDDCPDAHVARQDLLERLGIKTTHRRTRLHNAKAPKSKVQGPSEFHPVRLGKQIIYYFPLDGSPERLIDPKDYDNEVETALAEAKAFLERQ